MIRAMGMRPIVIDTGDAKKALCKKLGAEEFVDFKEHADAAARVKELTDGIGAHGVLVTAYQAYKGMSSSQLTSRMKRKPVIDRNIRCRLIHRRPHRWQDHVYCPSTRRTSGGWSRPGPIRVQESAYYRHTRGNHGRHSQIARLRQTRAAPSYC